MSISLIRIDDRMIHGQVVMSWIRHTASDAVYLIDDAVAADMGMIEILLAAAPANLDVKILSIKQALQDYGKWEISNKRILIIVRSPNTIVKMIEGGASIQSVNLGGLGMEPGKKRLYKNVSVSKKERKDLVFLVKQGINIYIQMIPTERRYEVSENI